MKAKKTKVVNVYDPGVLYGAGAVLRQRAELDLALEFMHLHQAIESTLKEARNVENALVQILYGTDAFKRGVRFYRDRV